MKGEWCFFESQISNEMCDRILEEGLQLPSQDPQIGTNTSYEDSEFRRGKIRFIQAGTMPWLFGEMWRLALWANHDWFGFHIAKLDYMQLAEYDSKTQDEYKTHQDTYFMTNNEYDRKLSAVIQLTDPSEYEGGDFEIFCHESPSPDPVKIKKRGSVIFMPSFMQHRAAPVTSGVRHSVACWFQGPHWR